MVVGAAADQPEPTLHQPVRERLRVDHDLLGVHLEVRLQGLSEADGLGGDRVHERPALDAWEHGRVDGLLAVGAAQDDCSPGTAQRLLRGRGDDVRVRDGRRIDSARHQARDVGHVDEERGADRVGDLAHALPVDDP